MSEIQDRIRAVLEAHPLVAGEDREAGQIICGSCHWILGDPARHLLQALVEVLDPDYQTPPTPQEPKKLDLRESQIEWETDKAGEDVA